MNCTRCQGLMAQDHFMDFEGTAGYVWAHSWRCMNCGHVYDAVIGQNRRAKPAGALVLAGAQPDDESETVKTEEPSYLPRVA